MKDESCPKVFFSEWAWCRGCKYGWKYEEQEPCKECLSHPIGPIGPIYYEKESNNV